MGSLDEDRVFVEKCRIDRRYHLFLGALNGACVAANVLSAMDGQHPVNLAVSFLNTFSLGWCVREVLENETCIRVLVAFHGDAVLKGE